MAYERSIHLRNKLRSVLECSYKCDILVAMNIEITEMSSYEQFLENPQMDGAKLLKDLVNTPFIFDYGERVLTEKLNQILAANKVAKTVASKIIDPVTSELSAKYGITDAPLGAVQVCLHPQTASEFAKNISSDSTTSPHNIDLMIAASHIGVAKLSELYQNTSHEEKPKMEVYAKYFAAAQAWLLGGKTSTTLLALNLEDKGNLRQQDIAALIKVEDIDELKKFQTKEIFTGHEVSKIIGIGDKDGFFLSI